MKICILMKMKMKFLLHEKGFPRDHLKGACHSHLCVALSFPSEILHEIQNEKCWTEMIFGIY
jgi:hypothetical protein